MKRFTKSLLVGLPLMLGMVPFTASGAIVNDLPRLSMGVGLGWDYDGATQTLGLSIGVSLPQYTDSTYGWSDSINSATAYISGLQYTGTSGVEHSFTDGVFEISDGTTTYLSATLTNAVLVQDGSTVRLNPGLDIVNVSGANLDPGSSPSRFINEFASSFGSVRFDLFLLVGSVDFSNNPNADRSGNINFGELRSASAVVPEPSSVLLVFSALGGLVCCARKRK